MKFNFKKVASVIASAVMITSTVGFAAATTYPAPFSSGATIVYGSAAASSDIAAAISIQNNLNAGSTVSSGTTGGVSVTGGDNYQFTSGSQKLWFGKNLSDVRTSLTSDQLPVLLASGTYRNTKSNTYDYDQKITMGTGLQFTQFRDSDYSQDVPTVGVVVPENTPVLNYTTTFVSYPESTVTSGVLDYFANTKLTLLGKQYTLMRATYTGGNVYLELMAGAARDTVNLNEEKTFTVGNSSYSVKLTYTDGTNAKFTVNGETTDSIAKGEVYKLSDGSQIAVNDISYQNFAGGIMAADISLGADKLELTNGAAIKVNEKTVDDVTAVITNTTSGSNLALKTITLQWTPVNNKLFLTQGSDLVMPGLKNVKLTMGNLTVPKTETTKIVADGDTAMKLETTVKDGDYSLDFLYGNTSNVFTGIGKSSTKLLATSNTTSMTVQTNVTANFVASWHSGSDSESYILKLSNPVKDSTTNVNTTILTNLVTGKEYENLKPTSEVNLGNVVLTVDAEDPTAKTVTFHVGGDNLNTLYTKDGLMITLPVNTASSSTVGYINLTNSSALPTSYGLIMTEASNDTSNNVGQGGQGKAITTNLHWDTGNFRDEVANVTGSFTGESGAVTTSTNGFAETADDSKIYVGYETSALGTKVTYDTNPNQATASFEYHGGETYGNVFVATSGAVVTPGSSSTGSVANVVTDKDVGDGTAYANTNLVVVGGSCINTVALKIISPSATAPVCGNDFTLATHVSPDQYLIKTVANPYAATGSSNVAMLVAGYEAADTTNAAAKVLTGVDTTVGASQVYPIVAATP